MPGVGLEPTTSYEVTILSRLRKPFRHPGFSHILRRLERLRDILDEVFELTIQSLVSEAKLNNGL